MQACIYLRGGLCRIVRAVTAECMRLHTPWRCQMLTGISLSVLQLEDLCARKRTLHVSRGMLAELRVEMSGLGATNHSGTGKPVVVGIYLSTDMLPGALRSTWWPITIVPTLKHLESMEGGLELRMDLNEDSHTVTS